MDHGGEVISVDFVDLLYIDEQLVQVLDQFAFLFRPQL
jgi:hypothetical protein